MRIEMADELLLKPEEIIEEKVKETIAQVVTLYREFEKGNYTPTELRGRMNGFCQQIMDEVKAQLAKVLKHRSDEEEIMRENEELRKDNERLNKELPPLSGETRKFTLKHRLDRPELREKIKDRIRKSSISVYRPDFEEWLDVLTDQILALIPDKED